MAARRGARLVIALLLMLALTCDGVVRKGARGRGGRGLPKGPTASSAPPLAKRGPGRPPRLKHDPRDEPRDGEGVGTANETSVGGEGLQPAKDKTVGGGTGWKGAQGGEHSWGQLGKGALGEDNWEEMMSKIMK